MEDPSSQDLHQLALRMRRDMPCKERIIHLQTFKWTFNGQQAVSYLLTHGVVQDAQAAVELCQRMLQQGLFKSIYHKDLFTADSEIYRFSSSMLDNKHKGLTGLTSTGLYKEIAKFGKAAAQPFKQVSVQLNDTFANLGSLSAVAPKLGVIGANGAHGGPGSAAAANGAAGGQLRQHTPLRLGRLQSAVRRSQTSGKHEAAAGHHTDNEPEGFAEVITQLQALQGSIKESSGLLRIDLQQHTALQEHLVGLLMAQQRHNQVMQALAGVIAAAASLLLAAAGTGPLWPVQLVGWVLLAAVVVLVAPRLLEAVPRSIAGGMLGRAALPVEGSVDTCRTLMPQQSNKGAPKLDRVSMAPSVAAEAGSGAGSAADDEMASSDSDSGAETDWEDMGPSLQDFDEWPDAPVMMCPDPADRQQSFACDTMGPCQALPLNSGPIPFESELFRGVVAVYVRHLSSTPGHMFKGKKRLIWIALQGTFKRPVSMDSLVFGQEFSRKLCNLPAPWFIDNMLLPLARKISPALRVGNLEQPYLYSPLITASQIVNVSVPGCAPQLMEAKEDVSLITDDLLSVAARRKHFQSAAHRTATSFTTEHVWTFHLWQEYLDFAAYLLNLSYSSYDLTQHLDGQPLQVMAKDVSCGAHLVNLHVWHSNLVRSSQRHLHRPPTRMRSSSRIGTEVQADSRSTRVTVGGTAVAPTPPSEPFSPVSMAASHPRLSDAGTAVTVGTLGTDAGSRLEAEEAEQLLLQAQSPVASARDHATGTESPGSLHDEHWFDARYSHSQQESPERDSRQQQQQQAAEQQSPWLEALKHQSGQQQQHHHHHHQSQQQRPSSFSNAYQSAAAAAGEQQQHAKSFTGAGKQQQQQQQHSPQPEPRSAPGSGRDAAAASAARLLGLRASQLIEVELAEAPARSGGSASSALSSAQDSSRQLQSMRSL